MNKKKNAVWREDPLSSAKQIAGDLFYDVIGSILFAAGLYTFAGNAGFAPGGVSGLALIFNALWNLPIGTVTLLLNLPLAVMSYHTVGKRFIFKTMKTMVISTIFLDVVFPMFPMYQGQRMVAALYSGALIGGGMVLFYMRGSSSGGADFLIMTIKKKKPYMSIGMITMLIDLAIIMLGWPVFGDVDSVLYGLVSTFISTIVIDKILYGKGAGNLIIIITEKGREVADCVMEYSDRGVTNLNGTGGYTGDSKDVLLCACSKSEAYEVRKAVKHTDPTAFLMFTETSEVYGEGFRQVE